MKRLKNLSLFKIAILFIINLYLRNIFVLIFSLIYLLIIDKYELIIFIILLSLNLITNTFIKDFIKIGYVEDVKSNYVTINKIIYKQRVYDTNVNYGDIVFTYESNKNDDKDLLKKNILYTSYKDIKVIKSNTLMYKIYELINYSNDEVKNLYNKILLNEYVSDLDLDYYLGYGLCIYYLLKKLFDKNKYISLISLIIYSILFGFEIKLLLIILDFILSFINIESINKLSIKLIFIAFINVYLFLDYSLLITFIFIFINLSNYSNNVFIMSLLQSLLFGQIQLFTSFFFNYYIKLRIIMFIISLISLFMPLFNPIYLLIISIISNILKVINFSVRGKVSIITLLILLIIRLFKVNNKYFYLLVLLICLISPLNNPFKHVSFINVGQGDSILIKGSLNSYNVLIDTGSTYNYSKLKKYLINESIYNIDYLIITHEDSDHSGNIESLKKDFNIKNIITSPIDINIKDLSLKNFYLGYFNNDNDNSLIYQTVIDDTSFLFTGDISRNIERLLINVYELDVDVLKVSHHGSKTGSDSQFIGNILPTYAIISTSGYYGHPHEETINALDSFKVNTLSTKIEGTISFYFLNIFNLIKTDNNKFIFY